MKEDIRDIVADIRNKLAPLSLAVYRSESEENDKNFMYILKRLKDIEDYKEPIAVQEEEPKYCSNCGQCAVLCDICEDFDQFILQEKSCDNCQYDKFGMLTCKMCVNGSKWAAK